MSASVVQTLTRAVSWTAGLVEGLVTGMFARRRGESSRLPIAEHGVFLELRLAILGRSRRQIATALGVPPTASLGFGTRFRLDEPATYWQATTWYYPFDQEEHKAIAIHFVGERAREVEFIGTP